MRGPRREHFLVAGKVMLACALGTSAVVALASGRLGWTNYWGGFVYAPFALLIAVFLALVIARKRDGPSNRRRRRT